jgi:hypothetical protein
MRRLLRSVRFLARNKILIPGCLATVVAVRLGLTFSSYNTVRRWIRPATTPAPEAALARYAWGVTHTSRYVPGASCLTQALALQFLLARKGYRSDVRVGVAREDDGRFRAHAWVLSEGRIVIGGTQPDLERYTVLTDLKPN